jgi:hypothetical protein
MELVRFEAPGPRPQHAPPPVEVVIPTASRQPRVAVWAGGRSTPGSTAGNRRARSAQMGKKASQ